MSERAVGPIFVRQDDSPEGMRAGQAVIGHRHHFAHVTFCMSGALRVTRFKAGAPVDVFGRPESGEIESVTEISAGSRDCMVLIEAGVFHALEALEDGTRYACVYAHRAPQALTLHAPGALPQDPPTMRDKDGVLWVRVNEDIVQEHTGWRPAYI